MAGMASQAMADGFAGRVVSYNAGATPAARTYWQDEFPWGLMETAILTDPSSALGEPARFVDEPHHTLSPGSIVSPFSPAANEDQIVSIGEGGSLTLELENYAVVGPGADIGLFTNLGLQDAGWPDGKAGDPAGPFGIIDSAIVEVSYDRSSWISLGTLTPDVPTSAWTDASEPYAASTAGLTAADFSAPFAGRLSDFDGKTLAEINTMLAGSGGGYWLDLSGTGLIEIGYIRFSVPDDGDAGAFGNFELDAVSIASGHLGAPLPEPCSMSLLALGGVALVRRRRK